MVKGLDISISTAPIWIEVFRVQKQRKAIEVAHTQQQHNAGHQGLTTEQRCELSSWLANTVKKVSVAGAFLRADQPVLCRDQHMVGSSRSGGIIGRPAGRPYASQVEAAQQHALTWAKFPA